MASRFSDAVQQLFRVIRVRGAADLADIQLLERFVTNRDEAAFEALVRRHGALVFAVCRRALNDIHDAEDAFQATFLVLARKAGSISKRQCLATWLYRVAYRTARRAARTHRRAVGLNRTQVALPDIAMNDASADNIAPDLRRVLDEEVNRLPEKYRAPIILCYFQGKSKGQAARELRCPEGTVSGRLARAREMLRKRLVRRGVTISAGMLATALCQEASAALPPQLIFTTAKAAALFATRQVAIAGVISAHVAGLAKGVLRTMVIRNLGVLSVALVGFLAGASGSGMLAYGAIRSADDTPATESRPTPPGDASRVSQKPLDRAFLKGLLDEALESIRPLSDDGGQRVDSLSAIAVVQAKLGDRTAADKIFREATDIAKGESIQLDRIAEAQAQIGDLDAALRTCSLMTQSHADGTLQRIGQELARQGRPEQAYVAAEKAKHEGFRIGTYQLIFRAQLDKGDLAAAEKTVERIAEGYIVMALAGHRYYEQDIEMRWWGLATAQYKRGDKQAARKTLQRAIELVPKAKVEQQAWACIAGAQAFMDDFNSAAATVQKIKDEKWRARAIATIAMAHAEHGNFAKGLETVATIQDKVVKVHALILLGGQQAKKGDKADARKTHQQVFGMIKSADDKNDNSGARHVLASAQAAAGNIEGAIATAQLISDRNRTGTLTNVVYYQAGLGDIDGALRTLAGARDDHVWWRSTYGSIAQMQAERGGAEKALDWGRKLGPLAKAWVLIGVVRAAVEENGK